MNFRFFSVFLVSLLALSSVPTYATDAEPENAAPVIRSITVHLTDVFEDVSKGSFYSTANSLKINTHENVIRRELIFKEGDRYDQFQIEESERVLRTLRYLRNVSIIPTIDGEFVDINVYAQDTWTLIPYLSASMGAGSTDHTAFGITESNLLGFGKRAEVLFRDENGRESIEGVWDDQRVFGTKNNLLLGYFDRSDGYQYIGNGGLPFRSLKDKAAWNISASTLDNVGKLYDKGTERFIFGQEKLDLSAFYAFALGDPEKLIHRLSFGYDYFDYKFRQATDSDYKNVDVDPASVSNDPALLPSDRRFSYPFFAYSRIEPDFISHAYVDRFDRVQDFNLGNVFEAKLGYATEALGSSVDSWILSLNDADGFKFSDRSFVRGEIGAGGRYEEGDLVNGLLRSDLKYVYLFGPLHIGEMYIGNHTFVASSSLNYGYNLDGEREFYMGSSSGLRGYDSRTWYGDKSFIIGAEERFHLFDDVLELVSVGGAVFVEGGGATEDSLGTLFANDMYGDAGFGLRFGFPRSTGGRVLRLDFSFPFKDGPDGSNGFQVRLSVSGGQIIDAILDSEKYKSYSVNVDSGFED